MFKTTVLLILLFGLLQVCSVRRKKRENVLNRNITKWRHNTSNCSRTPIDVRLLDLSMLYSEPQEARFITANVNHTGLVEVLIPRTSGPLFLCFPKHAEDYKQAYRFSHITCRQLGFMTFVAMNPKELPPSMDGRRRYGLRPNSYTCTGQEQSLSNCIWNDVSIFGCQMLTEISCGACHSVVKDSSGVIRSPGFPLAFISDVTCEWDIIVPEEHTILLTFNHFDVINTEFSAQSCRLHKPYVEIMYGNQTKMSVHRYCNLREVKNLSISFNEVKIRIFTGLFSHQDILVEGKEQGIAISFEAIPATEASSWPWKTIFLTLFFLSFIAITVLCHYIPKYKFCQVQDRKSCTLPVVNAPNCKDLDRAFEFQRCKIQGPGKEKLGLRLRSIGSGANISRLFFGNTPSKNYEVPKGFRKLLSQVETPKTVIPAIILNDDISEAEKESAIWRVKANLLDRYSDSDNNNTSSRLSVDSAVFYSAAPSFHIYKSTSSEMGDESEKIKPELQETAL